MPTSISCAQRAPNPAKRAEPRESLVTTVPRIALRRSQQCFREDFQIGLTQSESQLACPLRAAG